MSSIARQMPSPSFFDVVQSRRAVRTYRTTPVEAEKVQAVLQAAHDAPSAGNLQCYEIYKVTDPKRRFELARAANEQLFLLNPPVLLVFCANPARTLPRYGERGRTTYPIQDATIACAFAMLAAKALGLATVWVGALDAGRVREIVGAPPEQMPLAILPLGYSDEMPEPPERRALEDLVHEL
jgi:nitroreductase